MSQKFLFRYVLNPIMTALLKSPLHKFVSQEQMLITFTGRKSGKRYTTPVGYIIEGDTVLCFTDARWWKNLRGGAPVTLHIRGQERQGQAEAIADDAPRIAEGIRKFLARVPSYARFYQLTLDQNGEPHAQELLRVAAQVVMIEIQLSP
jgi:deazaflavin-dependent oxidoreductase (nitroreductase family)